MTHIEIIIKHTLYDNMNLEYIDINTAISPLASWFIILYLFYYEILKTMRA